MIAHIIGNPEGNELMAEELLRMLVVCSVLAL